MPEEQFMTKLPEEQFMTPVPGVKEEKQQTDFVKQFFPKFGNVIDTSTVDNAAKFFRGLSQEKKKEVVSSFDDETQKHWFSNIDKLFDDYGNKYAKGLVTGDIEKDYNSIESITRKNNELEKINNEFTGKLGTGGQAEIQGLEDKLNSGLIDKQEYYNGYAYILDKYNAKDDQIKLIEKQVEGIVESFSIVTGEPKERLQRIMDTRGYEGLYAYTAKKLGVSGKELDNKVNDVINQKALNIREKTDIDIGMGKIKELSNRDTITNIGLDIFRRAGAIVDDDDKNIIGGALFKQYENLTPQQQKQYDSLMGTVLKGTIKSASGRTLFAGEKKEDGELLKERTYKILNSEEFLKYQDKIAEMVQNPEFYEGGRFDTGKFEYVMSKTLESRQLDTIGAIEESKIEKKIIESDKSGRWNPIKNLQGFATKFDQKAFEFEKNRNEQRIGWLSKGDAEKKFEQKNIDSYEKGMDIVNNQVNFYSTIGKKTASERTAELGEMIRQDPTKIFTTWALPEALSMPVREGYEDIRDMFIWGGNMLTSALFTPYSSKSSAVLEDMRDSLLRKDPEYMGNSYLLSVEAGMKIKEELLGNPSDIAMLAATMGMGSAVSALAKAKGVQSAIKGSKVIGAIADATIANPNSKFIRDTSEVVYGGLKNIANPTNAGINLMFQTKYGVDPLLDYGIDAVLPVFGWLRAPAKIQDFILGGYREIEKIISEKGLEVTSIEAKNLRKQFLIKNGLYNGITDDIIEKPFQVAALNSQHYSDLAKNPNKMAEITSDAVAKRLGDGTEESEKLAAKMREHITKNYPEYANELGKGRDIAIFSEILKGEGAMKLDNLYKYRFINYEFDLAKNSNPVLAKVDEIFNKTVDLSKSIKDEKLRTEFLDLAQQSKVEAIASSYSLFNKGIDLGASDFSTKFDSFVRKMEDLGAVKKGEVANIYKQANIETAIKDFNTSLLKGKVNSTKDALRKWNQMSDQEKGSIYNGLQNYIFTASDTDTAKLFKDIGIDEKYINKILQTKTKYAGKSGLMRVVMDALGNKFAVGSRTINAGNYVEGISKIIEGGRFLNKTQANQFYVLSNLVTGLDNGDIGYTVLNDATRDIFNKISQYMDINAVDKKNMMLNDMLNISMIDGMLMKIKKGEKVGKDGDRLIRNISEGRGHRIFGSLKSSTKQTLLDRFMKVPNMPKFLKDEGLKQYDNVEDAMAALFTKSFKGIIVGSEGAITKQGEKFIAGFIGDFSVKKGDDIKTSIEKIVNNYIDATEGLSKYLGNNNTDESIIIAANLADTSTDISKGADEILDTNIDIRFDGGDYNSHIKNKLENVGIPYKDGRVEYKILDGGKDLDRNKLPIEEQKKLVIEAYQNSAKQNNELLNGFDYTNKSGFGFSKDTKMPGDNDLILNLNDVVSDGKISNKFKNQIQRFIDAVKDGRISDLKFTHSIDQKNTLVDFSKKSNLSVDEIISKIESNANNKTLRINYQNLSDVSKGKGKMDTEIFIEDGKGLFEVDTKKAINVDLGNGATQKYLTPEGYLPYGRDLVVTDLNKEFKDTASKLKVAKRIDDMMDAFDVIDMAGGKASRTIIEKLAELIQMIFGVGKKGEVINKASIEKLLESLKQSEHIKIKTSPLNKQYKDAVGYLETAIKEHKKIKKGGERFAGTLADFRRITEPLKSDIKSFKQNPTVGMDLQLQKRIDELKKYDFSGADKFPFFNEVHLITTTDGYLLKAIDAINIKNAEEPVWQNLNTAIKNTKNIDTSNIINSGIDMPGAITIRSMNGVTNYIKTSKDADEMASVLSNAIYSNTYQESIIADMLKDQPDNYKKYQDAIEIAKERRIQAATLFGKFFDGKNIKSEIEYNGKKISLSSILSNMEYKITKHGLITTIAHNIPKNMVFDNAEIFFNKETGMMEYLVKSYLDGKDSTKIIKGLPEGITSYTDYVDNVYKKILELTDGDKDLSSDVISRMIVGMPQYMDELARSKGPISIERMAYTIVESNKKEAIRTYRDIYEGILTKLRNTDENITAVGTKITGVRKQRIDKQIKNYQMVLMDGLIKDYVKNGFAISERGFMDLMLSHAIDSSATVAGKYFNNKIKNINKIAAIHGLELFGSYGAKNAENYVSKLIGYLEENKDILGKYGWFDNIIKDAEKRNDGIPSNIKRKELDAMLKIYNGRIPKGQTLESFSDDVIDAEAISKSIEDHTADYIKNSIEYGAKENLFLDSMFIKDDMLKDIKQNKTNFEKGISKIFGDSKTVKEVMSAFDEMNNFDMFGKVLSEDGIQEAKNFLYNAGFSKKIFEFKGDGFRSEVINKSDGVRVAGDVRLYEDYNYDKTSGLTKWFLNAFSTTQNVAKNSDEMVGYIQKSLRARKSSLKLGDNKALDSVVKELFPDRSDVGYVYLQTFINAWKKKIQEIVKSGSRSLDGDTIRNSLVEMSSMTEKEIKSYIANTENGGLNRYMYAYWEAINSARRGLGLSDLATRYDVDTGKTTKSKAFGEFLEDGVFGDRKLSTKQGTLDMLEGFDGLWIGLDVADLKRVKEITGLLGTKGYRRYLFNSFKDSAQSGSFWNSLLKGARKTEMMMSAGMYGVLFNPIISPQSFTQQMYQNTVHRMGKAVYELAGLNDNHLDELVDIFEDTKSYDIIEGQIQQTLMSPLENGKKILYNLPRITMGFSAQGISDKIAKKSVIKNAMSSSLSEFGYTPEAAKNMLETIGIVQNKLADGLGEFVSIDQLLFRDEDYIRKLMSAKLANSGLSDAEKITKINDVVGIKKSLGNFGEIIDNAYMKVSAFFQFSNIPEIANSLASSKKGSWAWMKFMNWSSKKASEYGTDFAMAIARRDKKKLIGLTTNLISEGLYAARGYSMLDRLTDDRGDSEIDPIAFAMSAYTPFLVFDMTMMNAMSSIMTIATGDKIVKSDFMGFMNNIAQSAADKPLMSVAYTANMLLTPFMTLKEAKQIGIVDQDATAGVMAQIMVDSLQDQLRQRGNRFGFTKKIDGINTVDPNIDIGNLVVNNIMGARVTRDARETDALMSKMYDIRYSDADQNDIGITLLNMKSNGNIIMKAIHNFKQENNLYDYTNGTNIAERLGEYNDLSEKQKAIQDEEDAKKMADYDAFLETAYLKSDVKNEVFDKVTSELITYNPKTRALDIVAEKGVDIDEVKGFTKSVISYLNDAQSKGIVKKTINDVKDSADIWKWKTKLGDKIFYGTLLLSIAKNNEALAVERAEAEYMVENGLTRKQYDKLNTSIKNTVKDEAKSGISAMKTELISDSYETIKALDERIPIMLSSEHFKMLTAEKGAIFENGEMIGTNAKDITNKSYGIAEKDRMMSEVLSTEGAGYIGTRNIYSSIINSTINSTSKMGPEKKKAAIGRIKSIIDLSLNKAEGKPEIAYSIGLGLVEGTSKLPEIADDYKEEIEKASDIISKSGPLTDEDILDQMKKKYFPTGGGGSKAAKKIQMNSDVTKLNKLGDMADEIKHSRGESLGRNKTSYILDGFTIKPIVIARSKEEQIIEKYQYFTPPAQLKTPELDVKPSSIKTVKSKTYKPTQVRTVKKSFKRS